MPPSVQEQNRFSSGMNASFSRRLLPWTLLLVLVIASTVLYFRAPRGDFEFDLRDPKLAAKPAAGYFELVRRKLEARAAESDGCEDIEPVEVFLKLEGRTQRALFGPVWARGRFDAVTVSASEQGAMMAEEVVSLDQCAERLRDYFRASEAIASTPYVIQAPPDCTLRQWADFLRMGEKLGITWAAHSSH